MPTAETAASIGKSVQIYGEVKGSEDLVIDGVIEGTITLNESRLTIGPNAHVQANVSARDVIILGALIGDINASGRVELRSGANLKGDVRASRLAIEENAVMSGKIDLAATERPSTATASASPTATSVTTASSGVLFGAAKQAV
jgi:cytoskeletal protein CcmA (bactofilin family)